LMKYAMIGAAVTIATFSAASAQADGADRNTTTPIKHVIVVVGENVSFDTLFGAYIPPKGQKVFNLLSQGIIKPDGSPGPRWSKTTQKPGINSGVYTINPKRGKPYAQLPQVLQTGIVDLQTAETNIGTPDTRFPANLPNGPFQISHWVGYGTNNSATGDPAHRFFQMWQQTGGDNKKHDLFLWTAITAGTGGDNGATGPTPSNVQQGGELMGFFNMAQGDAPFFSALAKNFAMSDNFHQSIMGGTGANFFAIATGDAAVYTINSQFATPPINQIEDPNPQQGTANFFNRDGYKGGSYVNCSDPTQPGVSAILGFQKTKHRASHCESGAYYLVNNYDPPFDLNGKPMALAADQFVYPPQTVPTIGEALSNKGVSWKWYTGGRDGADVTSDPLYQQAIQRVTAQVKAKIDSQVPKDLPEPGRSQTVTKLLAQQGTLINQTAFALAQKYIYNNIGDPHNASANVVGNPQLSSKLKGLDTFYRDVEAGTLPAVSYVVPKNASSGHPGYSVPALYEQFLSDLVKKVQSNATLWAETAIIITTDEGGGYFDTGYIQNLDFFGDGPRIPFLVVSPFAKKGYVDHVYHDHASILKFIERNWQISPLSPRSRDRLPNPKTTASNPYRPANEPALGDLMSLFSFGKN
ncbi:MAG: alkaline phosphatase family protein, partial [Methylococcaceae bacterium]|nr:alkaline phosphatase family protein [Methylococcaceae bacterium]